MQVRKTAKMFWIQITLSGIFFLFLACRSTKTITNTESNQPAIKTFQLFPLSHTTNHLTPLQGLSGLAFDKESEDEYYFWSLTDRGPNLDPLPSARVPLRPFLEPKFSPRIYYFSISKKDGGSKLLKTIVLKDEFNHPILGLPPASQCYSEEIPIDSKGLHLNCQKYGIDSESIAIDDRGHFWIGEEYGPSIFEFTPDGKLQSVISSRSTSRKNRGKMVIPILPNIVSKRKVNRGFEAIAIKNKILFAMLQSPLPNIKNNAESSYIPIFKIDLEKKQLLSTLWYPTDNGMDLKIGDITFENDNSLLVLEQTTEMGKNSIHNIYRVAINQNLDTEQGHPNEEVFLKKELVLDLVKEGFDQFQKIEGLTYVQGLGIAVVNDNDFSVGGLTNEPSPTVLGLFTTNRKLWKNKGN
ncbi:MAG: hypothetical protein RJB66_1492 [Pseudomonadota bacterium]|jgi:3-phytase